MGQYQKAISVTGVVGIAFRYRDVVVMMMMTGDSGYMAEATYQHMTKSRVRNEISRELNRSPFKLTQRFHGNRREDLYYHPGRFFDGDLI